MGEDVQSFGLNFLEALILLFTTCFEHNTDSLPGVNGSYLQAVKL